jgi:polysaccharide export outer membrane protein
MVYASAHAQKQADPSASTLPLPLIKSVPGALARSQMRAELGRVLEIGKSFFTSSLLYPAYGRLGFRCRNRRLLMRTQVDRWFGFTAIWIAGLVCICSSSAQSTSNMVSAGVPNPTVNDPTVITRHVSRADDKGDYILGQADRLSIHVFGADDLSDRPVDVSAEGDIKAPLVGRVNVDGMSVRNLEAALTQAYSKYYKDPEVTVTVIEYRSQPVTVAGSVNTPGVIHLSKPARLMEVISQAGGLRADAGDRVLITRRESAGNPGHADDQKITTQSIDIHEIIEGKDPTLNVLVQSNDLITVPKAKMVYVVGEIGRPGGYVLDGHSSTITVLQALALAGGVTKTSHASQSRILRPGVDDSHRTETTVDLQKILANKAPDVELHADDILFVPNSTAKNAGIRALQMAADVGTGLAIWRF